MQFWVGWRFCEGAGIVYYARIESGALIGINCVESLAVEFSGVAGSAIYERSKNFVNSCCFFQRLFIFRGLSDAFQQRIILFLVFFLNRVKHETYYFGKLWNIKRPHASVKNGLEV